MAGKVMPYACFVIMGYPIWPQPNYVLRVVLMISVGQLGCLCFINTPKALNIQYQPQAFCTEVGPILHKVSFLVLSCKSV